VQWSPKENKIAYIHGRDWDISVRDYPGVVSQQLTPEGNEDGYCSSLVWSRDGKKIAYVQVGKLKIMDADGQNKIDITLNKPIEPILKISEWCEQKLMVISGEENRAYTIEIDMESAQGSVERLPVTKNGLSYDAVWSKDCSQTLYITENFGRRELWLINPDKSQAAILMTDTALEENTLLFRLALEFQSDLDKNIISESLATKFADYRTPLSENAEVEVLEAGMQWSISDKTQEKVYLIKKEAEDLSVYAPFANSATRLDAIAWSHTDESQVLFVGSHMSRGTETDIFLMMMNKVR
jgi:hypothetical protein